VIVTLRTASLDDFEIIHAIRRDAILGVAAETGLRDRQTWADSRSPAFFADRVAARPGRHGQFGGRRYWVGSSAETWITGLYVRTSWSGKGVGRRLMATLETEIVKQGHACARVESSPNAVGFYTRLGYIQVGLPDGEGAVPMKKRLRTADPKAKAV